MDLTEIDAGRQATTAAGVALQVGFNRRFAPDFAAAHDAIAAGRVGDVRLMRSLTRDPGTGLADPGAIPPWTIFTQTLIHDFDTLNWLNPGARAVDVSATADALVAPDFKEAGLLDTAVVVIRYDNGAIATAEANFAATYGYDVRGEVFGSRGMVTIGDGSRTSMRLHDAAGRLASTARSDTDLLRDAYLGEFGEFVAAIEQGRAPSVGADEAWAAFAIAEAAIESCPTSGPRSPHPSCLTNEELRDDVHAGGVLGDGLPRRAAPRPGQAHPRRRLRGRDLGLDGQGRRGPGRHRARGSRR